MSEFSISQAWKIWLLAVAICLAATIVPTAPTYAAARPSVVSVAPVAGPLAGGTTVTIVGANLSRVSQVTFGGVAGSSLRVESATKLTVKTPAMSTPGAATVVATSPGGRSTHPLAYTYAQAILPVHTGPMTSSDTWSGHHVLGPGFSVPAGVVLTLSPGAIVTSDIAPLTVDPGGSLISHGTTNSPVTISYLAARGAKEVILTHTLLSQDELVDVTATIATFTSVQAPGGLAVTAQHLSVVGSHISGYGLQVITPWGQAPNSDAPTVEGNTITAVGNPNSPYPPPAIKIQSSLFAPSKVSDNQLTGNAEDIILVGGSGGPGAEPFKLSEDWTISAHDARFALQAALVVPPGRTIRLLPGADLEFNGKASVIVQGALAADGTTEQPIRFRGLPVWCAHLGCWDGIVVDGDSGDSEAQLSLHHVQVEDSSNFGGRPRRPSVIADSTIVDADVYLNPYADITIVGNTFTDSPGDPENIAGGGARLDVSPFGDNVQVTITDNKILETRGRSDTRIRAGILVGLDHPPTVERNTVRGVQGAAIIIIAKDLDPRRLDGNQGTGNGLDTIALAGQLDGDLNQAPGTLAFGLADWSGDYHELEVPAGVTWTVPAGQDIGVVSDGWCQPCSDHWGPSLVVDGTFVARGTPNAPIRVRGASPNYEGLSLEEIAGTGRIDIDYADLGAHFGFGLSGYNGATITVGHSRLETWRGAGGVDGTSSMAITDSDLKVHGSGFTSAGTLSLTGTFQVDHWLAEVANGSTRIRGSIVAEPGADPQLVQACTWDSGSCSVNAAHVDWGPDGPLPENAEPKACGAVLVVPYEGGAAGQPTRQEVWSVPDCGGKTQDPYGQIVTASSDFQHSLIPYETVCASGQDDFQAACDMVKQRQQCLSGAVAIAESVYGPFDASDAAQVVTDGAAAQFYVAEESSKALVSDVAAKGLEIIQAAGTVKTVHDAYAGCVAPPK